MTVYRFHVAINIIPPGSKGFDDDYEREDYVAAPTSKAAAIKAIQEWVPDDALIHFIHVGRRLELKE